ncbi:MULTISPECIES: FtsX-like permease family protein [unclassified Crossiella]|uniref:ABC transporter permease n=1 Tax=unclassified Crossiella TaxID=2620835 RepID=UPI001FFE8B8D|nr:MULTISPECIES: FtsX-like permease family protein [unclassified Crossiella]MCK2236666.1 ABC transporter permease [Crossiella sp. S99.2]MCK2250334.1 ABC transporter permease [Crossiella sp. S99.1]
MGKGERDTRTAVRRWVDDLALGVRLAVGGSRNSWARLTLTAVGIGVGVAVLLLAASFFNIKNDHDDRRYGRVVPSAAQQPVPGLDPLPAARTSTEFRGQSVQGVLVQPQGAKTALPPGVSVLPKAGEYLVSPALAKLLDSAEGELLRPRFDGPRRLIDSDGLVGPHELFFYAGVADLSWAGDARAVYAFGETHKPEPLEPLLLLLVLVGASTMLIPVVVFIATSTRLAAAARDRRLAALRLVGADAAQTRRVAAGETLIGAVLGVLLGGAVFLLGRQLVELVELWGTSIFAADVRPSLWLVALIALGVPALAVVVSMAALRNTLVDPLGSVRQAKPVTRKLAWRLVPLVLGAGLLAVQAGGLINTSSGAGSGSTRAVVLIATGVMLLLLSIPLLLPWAIEKLVGLFHGGRPAWQLAVRRMQLDSGTSARVIGGLAVVLAGGIALQTVLMTAERDFPPAERPTDATRLMVSVRSGAVDPQAVLGQLRRTPGLLSATGIASTLARGPGNNDFYSVVLADCAELSRQTDITDCRPGKAWLVAPNPGSTDPAPPPAPGQQLMIDVDGSGRGPAWQPNWTVPAKLIPAKARAGSDYSLGTGILLPTGGLSPELTKQLYLSAYLRVDPAQPDAAEHVRNVLGPFNWRASVHPQYNDNSYNRERAQSYATVRRGVLIGVLVALLLAAASLLVIGFEQVRERRRPLAVLSANGVPRRTLAGSVLWQNAVPVLLAAVVSAGAGIGLGALLLRTVRRPLLLDWTSVGVSAGAAVLAALVVSLLTLPSVLRAMRPEGLRAE